MSNPDPSSPPPDLRSPPRIVIAGLGLITPLGIGAWPTFAALLKGRRITDRVDGLEEHTAPVPLVQAIGGVTIARHTRLDPTVELAERAAREAATEAGVSLEGLPTWLGTSKGAVGVMAGVGSRKSEVGTEEQGLASGGLPYASAVIRDPSLGSRHPSLAQAVMLGPHGYLAHHLEQRTGLRVHRHAVAACASSLVALDQARRHLLFNQKSSLNNPQSAFALVLTAEAALIPLFIHSYRRLGVLAPLNIDGYRCNPLDASRNGFVPAEVGAAVILKRLLPGELPGAGEIELIDTATACEADDLIRPSREMPALRHIATRLMRGHDIAAIHPHAPGTLEHDPAELAALQAACGLALPASDTPPEGRSPAKPQAANHSTSDHAPRPTPHAPHLTALPAVYAHKGALGHTLGSAGLVSLVIATLAARTGKLPPMPWLKNPMRLPTAASCLIPGGAGIPPGVGPKGQNSPDFDLRSNGRRDARPTVPTPALDLTAQPTLPKISGGGGEGEGGGGGGGLHAIFAAGFGGHVAGATLRLTRNG